MKGQASHAKWFPTFVCTMPLHAHALLPTNHYSCSIEATERFPCMVLQSHFISAVGPEAGKNFPASGHWFPVHGAGQQVIDARSVGTQAK